MILSTQYDDVNVAYFELQYIKKHYVRQEETRNGRALVFQGPVIVAHTMPYRRVLFDPIRDANPFFHYMEAIWMLAGAEDVNFPARFAKQIRSYSDDGQVLYGAYGHRWRHSFEVDQIEEVIEKFKKDPLTRRAVIGMYDPTYDTEYVGKDLPCNTHIYFRNEDGRLSMTVCNRSNDLVWGMLGANMVHMSILQEYIATALDMVPGTYYQFTNNLHVYDGWEDRYFSHPDPFYTHHGALPRIPFGPESLDWKEAADFVENEDITGLKSPILVRNAWPMMQAWDAHKDGDDPLARHYAGHIYDGDWAKACIDWLDRRILK